MESTRLIPSTTADVMADERSLSKSTKILCWIIFPGLGIAIIASSPTMAAILPILLLPTAWLVWCETKVDRSKRVDFETAVWTFFMTGIVGASLLQIITSLITYLYGLLLFGPDVEAYLKEWMRQDLSTLDPAQRAARMEMASRWQYWVFIFAVSFELAGCMEEGLKYCGLLYARRYGSMFTEKRHHVIYAFVAALGFSTMENIAFTYVAAQTESTGRLALTVLERVCLGPAMHLLTAGLMGINTMRKSRRKEPLRIWHVLGLSILFHGLFDFALLATSALDGNIGWVHPEGGLSLVFVVMMAAAIVATLGSIFWYRLAKYKVKLY